MGLGGSLVNVATALALVSTSSLPGILLMPTGDLSDLVERREVIFGG